MECKMLGVSSTRLVLLLLLLPMCQSSSPPPPDSFCRRLTLKDAVMVQENQCSSFGGDRSGMAAASGSGFLEVNGTTLERALWILQARDSMCAAVLVYARWCPFSIAFLPTFDTLSSNFPSVYHFAVHEAALQPSAFAYYGVYSFPTLILHNKTTTVHYHGPRTYKSIAKFYENFTGRKPVTWGNGGEVSSREEVDTSATAPGQKVLHDDLYLTLSVVFVILRAMFYLVPKLLHAIQQWGLSSGVLGSFLQQLFLFKFMQTCTG